MIEREQWPERELTRSELQRYLLGDHRIRDDVGLLGRMAEKLDVLERKVDRLLLLGYGVLASVLAALLALVANLLVTPRH